jgi:uncharacterized protein YaaN involved in tellurite resistance
MENNELTVTGIAGPIDKEGNVNLANVTPADLDTTYRPIANQLNEKDVNSILNYGAEIQNTISKQSDTFLSNVRRAAGWRSWYTYQ